METKVTSIKAATLRKWLEDKIPLTILDVRPQEQREEWFIPGSIHIDAYDKLKQQEPNALDGIAIPENAPIVTVCAAGKTSKIAAEQLEESGYEAYSLEGGMKAWSLSWNTAEIKDENLTIIQIRRTGKGCLSYLIASEGEAAVIDASVDTEVYESLAMQRGWRIKYVLDTHIHADHLSRSPELADHSGALLYMPAQDKLKYRFNKIMDGDTLPFGTSKLTAVHTPGHTLESTSYLINNKYLITGDTLFVDGVGRPDLKADEAEARNRAFILFNSLQKISKLSDDNFILPGHISKPVPFDSKIIGSSLKEVKEKVKSIGLPEMDFVNSILSKIPPTPPNYLTVTELNISGNIQGVDPSEIEAGANRCAIS